MNYLNNKINSIENENENEEENYHLSQEDRSLFEGVIKSIIQCIYTKFNLFNLNKNIF